MTIEKLYQTICLAAALLLIYLLKTTCRCECQPTTKAVIITLVQPGCFAFGSCTFIYEITNTW